MQTNKQLKNRLIGRKDWVSVDHIEDRITIVSLGDILVKYYYNLAPSRKHEMSFENFLNHFKPYKQIQETKENKTVDSLNQAKETLIRCGKQYDSTGNDSERIMDRVTAAYTAITNKEMTPEEANIFMECLELVRSQTTSKYNDDHYIDGINYFAMAGEESHKVSKE